MYSPTESAKVYERPLSRRHHNVKFNPKQVLEIVKEGPLPMDPDEDARRSLLQSYLDVSVPLTTLLSMHIIMAQPLCDLSLETGCEITLKGPGTLSLTGMTWDNNVCQLDNFLQVSIQIILKKDIRIDWKFFTVQTVDVEH